MKFDPLPIAEYDLTSLRILASVGKGNDAINYHVYRNDGKWDCVQTECPEGQTINTY